MTAHLQNSLQMRRHFTISVRYDLDFQTRFPWPGNFLALKLVEPGKLEDVQKLHGLGWIVNKDL